ncbi:MAG: 2-C-methyl-D-erythritol 2,4-cyclodiphosphate synthase [Nitrospinota bacterium]|nr:2-C-methyl-D-erythritol 2,4-cyclodiphosphate synthase [Nitrospinota bacterium]
MRVGIGYDVHRLVSDRPLILGGIQIPFYKGLDGHSDADVVIHAMCDALLGSVALGDIGYYFPDTEPKNKNLDSFIILKRVLQIVSDEGYFPSNFDVVIQAQKPRISPFVQEMRKKLSEGLLIDITCVSVKATTTEGLGFVGKEEGIAAHAICLVVKR